MTNPADNAWCIIHGTPGQDPLSAEGPFAIESDAQAKAAACAEARPDIAAIVDVLVHPDNVRVAPNVHSDEPDPEKRAQPSSWSLLGDLKHASYDPPPQLLVARLRELTQAVEAHVERLIAPEPLTDVQRKAAVEQEPALTHKPTGGPVGVELREHAQVLTLLAARLARLGDAGA